MLSPERLRSDSGSQEKELVDPLEDGEIKDVTTVPTPPAKRRKCGRESLLDRKLDDVLPKETLVRSTNIIWVDLEMTGLDIENDRIMEMACIVTDKNLNILEEGPSLVIHQTDEILEDMGEWCTLQHGRTGLTKQCKESNLSCEEVEQQMVDFVKKYCPKGRCELAGNSIHTDRKFLEKEMPKFLEWLHFRIIDVSSIRNVAWRWYPNFEKYQSSQPISHRALDDIRSSIDELQYYRDTVFKSREQYTADMAEESNRQVPVDDLFAHYQALRYKKISAPKTPAEDLPTAEPAVTSPPESPDTNGKMTQKPVCVTVGGEKITLFGTK